MNTPNLDLKEAHRTSGFRAKDLAVLGGMIVTIMSLYLTWEAHAGSILPGLQNGATAPLPGAYYANAMIVRTGFQIPVHWPVSICALLCGTGLLTPLTRSTKTIVWMVQGVCALTLVVIPLRFFLDSGFEVHPGVLMCAIGALSILFGMLERWRDADSSMISGNVVRSDTNDPV